MSDDIRVAIDTDQNPKVRRLVKELGGAAGWGLVGVWLYTARHRPKGILTGILRDEIEGLIGWRGKRGRLIGALERYGFIEWNEDGDAVIHDWPKHQPWIYHSEERSERARQAVNTRYAKPKETPEKKENTPTGRSTERSSDSSSDSRGKRTTPSPTPSPIPNPSPSPVSVDSRTGPLDGPSASSDDTPESRKAFLHETLKDAGLKNLIPGNGEDKGFVKVKSPKDEFIDSIVDPVMRKALFDVMVNGGEMSVIDKMGHLRAAGFAPEECAKARTLVLEGGTEA